MPAATDAVWVDVLPSMRRFGPALARDGSVAATGAGRKIGKALGRAMVASGVAVAAFTAVSIKQFSQFQSSLNEVFTLMPGMSQAAMDAMSDDVRSFAKEMGVATDKVIPALYQAISAGVPKENVFEFLEIAQKAAMGGVTELETAVDGISSVVNAYGEEVIDAATASDLMFTAVRLGKTTFGEMSSFLFQVIPTAAALGVEFGDVTAAIASMTAQGVPTRVATTQLRQAFVELSKDGGDASDTFKEIAGKSFKDFIAAGGNTADALELMAKHAENTGVGVNDLFGSVEAGNAALSLTGKGLDGFRDNIAEMADSAGATDAAYQQMDQGIGRAFERLKIQAADVFLEFGERLAPTVERVGLWLGQRLPVLVDRAWDALARGIEFITPLVSAAKDFAGELIRRAVPAVQVFGRFIAGTVVPALQRLVGWIRQNQAWLVPLAAAVGAIVLAVKAWNVALGIYRGIQLAVVKVTAAWNAVLAMNPIGLVVLAIVGLVAALVVAYQRSETFRNIVDKVWTSVRNVIGAVVGWFTGTAWPAIRKVYDGIAAAAKWLWEKAIKPAWEGIRLAVAVAVELIKLLWNRVLKPVWRAVGEGAMQIWRNFLQPVFRFIGDTWRKLLEGISQVWRNVLKPVWDAVSAAAKWMWERALQPVFRAVGDVWRKLLEGMGQVWRNVLKPVFDAVGSAAQALRDVVGRAVSAIGRAWDGLKRAFAAPVNWVIDNVINKFLGWVNRIADEIGVSFRIKLVPNVSWGSTAASGSGGGALARNRGGIIPGQGPDRDSVLTALTPGEFVWSRTAVDNVGAGQVAQMHEAARRGERMEMGDSPFGWLKSVATAALNWARKFIVNTVRPGFDAAMNLMDATVGKWGMPGQMAAGSSRKLGNSLLDWMAGIEDEADTRTPDLGSGIGWQAMWDAVRGAFPWARFTSGYRPGAITATGNPSYHGKGRAVDVAGRTPMNHPDMLQIANWIRDNYQAKTLELIYSRGPSLINGKPWTPTGVTKRNHFDHVHWAMDNGGWLMPGVSQIANWTGKPEAVLTDQQWRTLRDAAVRNQSGAQQVNHFTGVREDVIVAKLARQARLQQVTR